MRPQPRRSACDGNSSLLTPVWFTAVPCKTSYGRKDAQTIETPFFPGLHPVQCGGLGAFSQYVYLFCAYRIRFA